MATTDGARRAIATAITALLLPLAACRTPLEERAPEARYETIRPEWRGTETTASVGWVRFSAGYLDREEAGGDPVGDGITTGVDGGIDLARRVLTPSVEFGIAYTAAHVSLPATDDVEMWRSTVGMRATYYAKGWRPYARAGGFLRWSTQELEEPLDPYATGFYLGLGADWPCLEAMWLGPSFTYYQSISEDAPGGDAHEMLFALTATFRL